MFEAFERWGARYAEQLAHHLLAAGDERAAAAYARRGAERAASTLAIDRAAELYGIAVDCSDVTTGQGLELLIALGEACSNAGRGREAGEAFLRAAELASGDLALGLRRRAAEELMLCGRVGEGLDCIRGVLHAHGFRLPGSRASAIRSLLWNTAVIRLRRGRLHLRSRDEIDPAVLDRIDTCWTVCHGTAGTSPVLAAAFAARSAKLALGAGEPTRVAVTLGMHAAQTTALTGRHPRELFSIVGRAAEASDDPYARAFERGMRGVASYLCGDFATAREACVAAEAAFRDECRGVAWEIASMQAITAWSCTLLGRWREVSMRTFAQIREAEQRGDLFGAATLAMSTGFVTRLSADQPDELEREIDEYARRWGAAEMHYQHFFESLSRFYLALYRGDGRAAWDALAERKQQLRKAGHFRVRITRTLWLWYESIAALTVAADVDGAERDAWLRTAAGNARDLRRLRGGFATHSADTIDGLVALWRGAPTANAMLESAEHGLAADGRMLTVAGVRHCRGLAIGGDEGAALIAAADQHMRDQGIHDPARISAVMGARPPRPSSLRR